MDGLNPGTGTAEEFPVRNTEEFAEVFKDLYTDFAEEFNVDSYEARRARPDIIFENDAVSANGGPVPKRSGTPANGSMHVDYNVDTNQIRVKETTGNLYKFGVGAVIGTWLREQLGTGDRLPKYRPEHEFFRGLGMVHAATRHDEPLAGRRQSLTLPEDLLQDERLDGHDLRKKLEEEALDPIERNGHRNNYKTAWKQLSKLSGVQMASLMYDVARGDTNLVNRSSDDLRHGYGTAERIEELLDESLDRYRQ